MKSAEYHAHPALSKGMLDKLHAAPAKLKAWLDGDRPDPTPAMLFGTAFHAAVLEPHLLIEAPKFDKRTTAGKAAAAEFNPPPDSVVVDPITHAKVTAMRESVMAHPAARRLLTKGQPEVSVFSRLGNTEVKCRPDWLHNDGIIVDLKSTDDASPAGFSRSCANYRYHVQAAWYLDVCQSQDINAEVFVLIACEKSPPYLVGTYVIDARDLQRGRDEYQRDLDTYRECVETNEWPGYSNRIEVINLPRWATKEESCLQY